jgi:hypothetical protein
MGCGKTVIDMSYRCVLRVVLAVPLALFLHAGSTFAQPVDLGSFESFAVLGSTEVTNTGATTVNGDVGAFPGTTLPSSPPLTLAIGASRHAGDAVAAQAAHDALVADQALALRACGTTLNAPGGSYPGGTLATPGVYCFDASDVQITGNVVLSGAGQYVFKIAGTLTTGPAVQVQYTSGSEACKGSNVYWRVAGASATLGGSNAFVGTLLGAQAVTLGAATTVDGRVGSLDGAVTLAGNAVTACTAGLVFPAYTPIKVTGGGGINVPSPNDDDPEATGNGFANYGFNANPGASDAAATGSFNYLNHEFGPPPYHLHGTVTDVDVLTALADGSAQTVRFSGTCDRLPNCTFSTMVQDNGEPGRDDQFGVTIVLNGEVVEARSMRQVRNGNIQFHTATLTTDVNALTLRGGQMLRLNARLRRDRTAATAADAYVVLRTADGQMLSWTGSALVAGLVPLVRGFVPVDFDGTLLQVPVPAGTPPGVYTWMSALTDAGTLNLRSGVFEKRFTIVP